MNRGPDFIIIGAMKCATSTLHVQLAAQPGIFMTEPKEPNFFSDPDNWSRGPAWYGALYDGAGEGDLCGESSTHYTKLPTYPETVARIAAHTRQDTRFIYVLRHPIDRLISQYIHQWNEGVISEPIDTAIDSYPELIAYSRYAMQLEPYIEAFGRARILPVFFDRLTASPQEELERICAFIGYVGQPQWCMDIDKQNVSSQRLRPTMMLNILKYVPGSQTLRRLLIPESVRERIKDTWRMKERPVLSERNLAELTETFDRDLARLGGWLGVDLDCQSFNSVGRERAPVWKAAEQASP